MGTLAYQRGQFAAAAELLACAIAANPNVAHYHNNLGSALLELGRADEAIAAYEKSLGLDPDFADAHRNLADALTDAARLDEAIAHYARAAQLKPNWPDLLNNFGHALQSAGRHADALDRFREALSLDPSFAGAHANMGGAMLEMGAIDAALASHRAAARLRPDSAALASNLLYAMHFDQKVDDESLFSAHVNWAQKHASHLVAAHTSLADLPRAAHRPLRIGYVSQDLRDHPVGRFLFPILANHDRARFEIHIFSDVQTEDAFTAKLKSCFCPWHATRRLTDEQLARLIAEHDIDILIDLAGHTGGNRLLTFARKPARVHATWLGYPDTTGLSTIDFRITDAIADPPGQSDSRHTERLIRLPRGFLCYHAPGDLPPLAPRDGPPTFGSFNNLAKLSSQTLDLWRRILDATAGSRLLIKSQAIGDARDREALRTRLAAAGLPIDRLDVRTRSTSHAEHLSVYNEADVALDPTPYNGTTTTCEALAMGVPVVALAGARHCARVGASILIHGGFVDWVADSIERYIETATALAQSPPPRNNVRSRFLASPVCDGASFTRDLEAAYREMSSAGVRTR